PLPRQRQRQRPRGIEMARTLENNCQFAQTTYHVLAFSRNPFPCARTSASSSRTISSGWDTDTGSPMTFAGAGQPKSVRRSFNPLLEFEPIWFDSAKRQALVDAFG